MAAGMKRPSASRREASGTGAVAVAKKQSESASAGVQLLILALVVFVNSGNVLFLKYSRLVPKAVGQKHYIKTTVVLSSEFCKFFLSMGLLSLEVGLGNAAKQIYEKVIADPVGTLKVGVPAFLYTVQNYLFIFAAAKLTPAVLQVTCQTKTLTTALFTTILLGKKFSLLQWGALIVLMAGVATTELAHMTGNGAHADASVDPTKAAADHFAGLLAVAGVCVCSGFAGVYIEKVLKGSDVSIWLRNTQLALCSLFVATALVAVKSGKEIAASAALSEYGIIGGFFVGWDWSTCVVLAFQCSGGLIVALVLKKASAVLKNFATAVAIIVIGIASTILPVFYTKQSVSAIASFWIGAVIVVISIFLYAHAGKKAAASAESTKSVGREYEIAPIVKSNSTERVDIYASGGSDDDEFLSEDEA